MPALAWLFPAGFVVFGGAMVAAALKIRRSRTHWEATASRAPGEVTDVRWESVGRTGDRTLLAFPVLRFALPDGRTVKTRSTWGQNPPAAERGAQVTVLYDPADPSHATLPGGATTSIVTGVIIGLGALMAAIGVATAIVFATVL